MDTDKLAALSEEVLVFVEGEKRSTCRKELGAR